MYVIFCQQEFCIYNGDILIARKVALDFADACMYSSSLAAWPGEEVCDTNSDLRRGTQCYDKCRFGRTSSNGPCECNIGYTGQHCDDTCPGSSESPCSLHGRCTEAGQCDCEHNWQGHSCDSCAENWYGTDCSVLVAASPFRQFKTTNVAFVTPTATYHTFDHVQFVVTNKIGVYSLFESNGDNRVNIQIHQVLCDLPSCVDAVALDVKGNSITIYAETDTKHWPSIYFGHTKLSYGEMSTRVSDHIDVSLLSTEKIVLHVKEPYLTNVSVYLVHNFLHVTVEVDAAICRNATGLLGSCDDNVDNDIPFNMSTASLDSIAADISRHYEVADDKSLFVTGHLKRLSQAGYAMSFNNTAMTSSVLPHSFRNATPTSTTISSRKDVTVSILVKPISYGGIILAYGNNKTFALTNDVNVTIRCGKYTFVTSSSNSLGEWNQLVLAYERHNKVLHYYHMDAVGALTYETFGVDCADFMDIGGRMTLGSWQASGDNVTHTLASFEGQIDDMSVWFTRLPHAIIYQLFHLNVKPSMFASELTYLYTFADHNEPTARDIMGAADFQEVQSPWQHPAWLPSNLEVYDLTSAATHHPRSNIGVSFQRQVDAICDSFFMSSVVTTSNIDNNIRDYFHSQCLQSGRRSANVKSAYFITTSYAELSRIASKDHNDLHTALCKGSTTQQPQWLKRLCIACQFGTLDDAGTCKCYGGYWGPSCSSQCPSSHGVVCSEHGVCLPDGRCFCDAPYSGTMCESVSCLDGSIAADCSVMQISSGEHGVMAVSYLKGQATLSTLDGTTFQLPVTGVYEVFVVESLSIWATVVDCDTPTRTARCFDSILLGYNEKHVHVNRSSSSNSHVTVWTDGRAVDVRSKTGYYGIEVVRLARHTLEISVERLHTLLIVEIETNGLTATILTTKAVWRAATGLISYCNTSVSIQATACNVVVDSCITTTLPEGCQTSISLTTVHNFSMQYLRSSGNSSMNITSVATSIYCEGSGMFTDNVTWLPRDGFSIEVHVKPLRYGGVFFSYTSSQVLAIVNDGTGLKVHYNGHIYASTLLLPLNMWSQLDLYWDVSMATLHVYLTSHAGDTRVFAVQLTASAFSPSGTMSIGQLPSEVRDVVNATFAGYLAEVRLWTRPHSGGVLVARNWRVAVTGNTPNLAHYWKLNDARGTVAFDVKSRHSFRATSEQNPPEWSVSNLLLTPVDRITKSDFASDSLKTASDKCAVAMARVKCVTDNELVESYLQQCVNDVLRLTSASVIQQVVDQYDKACYRRTVCAFGDHDTVAQSCQCRRGFWGDNCTHICTVALTGLVCNDRGLCERTTGKCMCHSRWMNVTVPFNKLARRMSLVPTDYACDSCTAHWRGIDCNTAADDVQSKWYTGVVTGSYVTTLDGASYEVVMPGNYQLLKTDDVSVQVLFVPCNEIYRCRQLVEVSVQSERALVSLQSNGGQLTVVRHDSDDWVAVHRGRTTTVGDLSVQWKLDNVVRIAISSGFQLVVAVVDKQLMCGVRMSKTAGVDLLNGLLGSANGNWKDDVNWGITDAKTGVTHIATDNVIVDSYLSTLYITRNMDRLNTDGSHLSHVHSKRHLNGGGYMLHMNGSFLHYFAIDIDRDMLEMSVSLWLKLYQASDEQSQKSRQQTVLVINMTGGGLQLDVFDSQWQVLWGEDGNFSTGVRVKLDTWQHVTLGWDGRHGGLLTIFVADEDGSMSARHSSSGMQAYRPLRMTSISFGANSQTLAFDLDFFTIWTYSRAESTVKEHMYMYTDDYVPDLLAAVLFDEGRDRVVKMTVYDNISVPFDQPQPRYIHGMLYSDNENTSTVPYWQPCDIPGLSVPLATELTLDTSFQTLISTCLSRLHSNKAIRQNAVNLTAVSQFYLEACVKDLSRNGSAKMTETVYTFYIHGIKDIEPCLLRGYLDYCVDGPDVSTPWYIWVPIVVILVIVILILVIVCACRGKRVLAARRCRQQVHATGEEGSQPVDESESLEGRSGDVETFRMTEFKHDKRGNCVQKC